jgi:hypothetical protein
MVVLALVLLILVVVFSVAIVVSNPAVYDLSLFRVMVPVTSAGVYFTGVGAALLTVVALLLLRLGIRRSRERRQRLKTAEQAAIGSASGAGKDSVPSTDRLADAPVRGEGAATYARRPPFPWWWSAVGHRPRRRHRVDRCSASR